MYLKICLSLVRQGQEKMMEIIIGWRIFEATVLIPIKWLSPIFHVTCNIIGLTKYFPYKRAPIKKTWPILRTSLPDFLTGQSHEQDHEVGECGCSNRTRREPLKSKKPNFFIEFVNWTVQHFGKREFHFIGIYSWNLGSFPLKLLYKNIVNFGFFIVN